jgi:uncharacterized peroxidase-related enzyme
MDDEISAKPRANPVPAIGTNLHTVEESQANSEIAAIYAAFKTRFSRPAVPGILKCFATDPAMARAMFDLASNLLFVDGHLTCRQKEMIAALVSSQNACPYCADSHGFSFLQRGGSTQALSAIQSGELGSVAIGENEQALLRFAVKVTNASHRIHRADVDQLISAGWTEIQIAEVVHIAALYAAFNRIANAFGLPSQELLSSADPA